MAQAAHQNTAVAKPLQSNRLRKRLITYGLLALVVFLVGFFPLRASFREAARRQAETGRQLRLVQLQAALGSAVIDARRGAYKPALELVTGFFASLQAALDSGEASDFSRTQRERLTPLLDGRAELIALLAREDPAAVARLSALYQSFNQILTGQARREIEAHTRVGGEIIPVK